jgi:hypothetical protein
MPATAWSRTGSSRNRGGQELAAHSSKVQAMARHRRAGSVCRDGGTVTGGTSGLLDLRPKGLLRNRSGESVRIRRAMSSVLYVRLRLKTP